MPHATSVRLDETKLNQLDALAKTMGKSRTQAINEALDQYLEYHEWFLASVRQGIGAADAGRVVSHQSVIDKFKAKGVKFD